MRCECFIILKLIWHRYLVFSLNNRAYKISTEISLRIIRISKRTSTKKTDDQVQTNQRDYISSKLDQVLNNHHLSRSSPIPTEAFDYADLYKSQVQPGQLNKMPRFSRRELISSRASFRFAPIVFVCILFHSLFVISSLAENSIKFDCVRSPNQSFFKKKNSRQQSY